MKLLCEDMKDKLAVHLPDAASSLAGQKQAPSGVRLPLADGKHPGKEVDSGGVKEVDARCREKSVGNKSDIDEDGWEDESEFDDEFLEDEFAKDEAESTKVGDGFKSEKDEDKSDKDGNSDDEFLDITEASDSSESAESSPRNDVQEMKLDDMLRQSSRLLKSISSNAARSAHECLCRNQKSRSFIEVFYRWIYRN